MWHVLHYIMVHCCVLWTKLLCTYHYISHQYQYERVHHFIHKNITHQLCNLNQMWLHIMLRSWVNAGWRHPSPREGVSSISVMMISLCSQIPCRKSVITLSILNEIERNFLLDYKRPLLSCMQKIRILL